jgi:asparagine synthase (glutamine-hydrolysing)
MCSIFGFYRLDPQASAHPRFLSESRRLMQHRGPDSEQVLDLGRMTMGHQRLSIVDLSADASQPMTAQGCALAYNGEIYNHPELSAESLRDVPFKSHSDTEVLLHLLQKDDVRCLNHLNGMWAFAFYEKTRQRLLLCRDRYGIKPLYYMTQDDVLYFSSEIKPLAFIQPECRRSVEVYRELLHIRAGDQDARTHLRGIYQVQRGHYLEIQPGSVQEHKWYHFNDYPIDPRDYQNRRDVVERTEELLTDALRICLRADVPVGITLSGGLDSSLLYTLATKRLGRTLDAFTLTKRDPNLDELAFVRQLTEEHQGVLHVCETATFENLDAYESVIESLEFPNWPLGSINGDRVYREVAAQGHRAIIEGHGSDELLGGYPEMISHMAGRALREGRLIRAARATAVYFNMVTPRHWMPTSRMARARFLWRRLVTESRNDLNQFEAFFDHHALPLQLRTFDRLSMRRSVESRCPFLDYRVVEWCRAMPHPFKVSSIGSKSVLRWILEKYGKTYIARNQRKQQFMTEQYHAGPSALRQARAWVEMLDFPEAPHLRTNALKRIGEGRLPANLALELAISDHSYGIV